MEEYLTDKEMELVKAFAENEELMEAVKKVLLNGVTHQGTLKKGQKPNFSQNWVFGIDQTGQMTEEEFGKAVITMTNAIVMVESSFNEIRFSLINKEKTKKEKKNVAR